MDRIAGQRYGMAKIARAELDQYQQQGHENRKAQNHDHPARIEGQVRVRMLMPMRMRPDAVGVAVSVAGGMTVHRPDSNQIVAEGASVRSLPCISRVYCAIVSAKPIDFTWNRPLPSFEGHCAVFRRGAWAQIYPL